MERLSSSPAEEVSSNNEVIINKGKWADENESSDEEEEEQPEPEDEESEESDDDEEVINDVDIVLTKTVAEKQPASKPKDLSHLSKKERKELQQKEIDELDAILSEFGTSSPTPTSSKAVENNDSNTAINAASGEQANGNTYSKLASEKKKKKKKPSTAAAPQEEAISTSGPSEAAAPSGPIDIAAILKNRVKKTAKKNVSDAVQEALKAASGGSGGDSKKKRKEQLEKKKKGYSEYSM